MPLAEEQACVSAAPVELLTVQSISLFITIIKACLDEALKNPHNDQSQTNLNNRAITSHVFICSLPFHSFPTHLSPSLVSHLLYYRTIADPDMRDIQQILIFISSCHFKQPNGNTVLGNYQNEHGPDRRFVIPLYTSHRCRWISDLGSR